MIERRARGAFDNAAEDVGVVAVDPRLARLRREGQRGEPLHGVADGLVLVGGEPSEPGGRTEPLRLVKCGDIGAGAVRNAGRMREEIANGDGPFRGHDLHLSLVTRGNGRVGVRRNVTAHRFVDADLSFFDQRQDRRARDGFRLRRDAEDRVGRHAPAGFLVAPAERPFVDRLTVSKNERDGAGEPVLVDILLQSAIDALQAVRRQPGRRLRGGCRGPAEAGKGPAEAGHYGEGDAA